MSIMRHFRPALEGDRNKRAHTAGVRGEETARVRRSGEVATMRR